MADHRDILNGLKYQLQAFIDAEYTTLIAGGGISTGLDIKESLIYHIEPFDEEDSSSYSSISWGTEPNYNIVVTHSMMNPTPDFPVGFLREKFECDIVIVRRTLRTHDYTNNRNLIMFGGDDEATRDITSIAKLCSDLKKWFRTYSLGGRLNDGTADNCFKADITTVSELANAKDEKKKTSFWYVVCHFEALSMETVTITAI